MVSDLRFCILALYERIMIFGGIRGYDCVFWDCGAGFGDMTVRFWSVGCIRGLDYGCQSLLDLMDTDSCVFWEILGRKCCFSACFGLFLQENECF